jgi:transcriptional regulator with XRE-family HTH domain
MDFKAFLRQLGETLRAHRTLRGLTQEDLGSRLGVSTQWVSEIERGNGAPSLELLFHLARLLDTSISDLTQTRADKAEDREALNELVAFLQHQPAPVLRATAAWTTQLRRAGA